LEYAAKEIKAISYFGIPAKTVEKLGK